MLHLNMLGRYLGSKSFQNNTELLEREMEQFGLWTGYTNFTLENFLILNCLDDLQLNLRRPTQIWNKESTP